MFMIVSRGFPPPQKNNPSRPFLWSSLNSREWNGRIPEERHSMKTWLIAELFVFCIEQWRMGDGCRWLSQSQRKTMVQGFLQKSAGNLKFHTGHIFTWSQFCLGGDPPPDWTPTCTKSNPAPPPGGQKFYRSVEGAGEKNIFLPGDGNTGSKKNSPRIDQTLHIGPFGGKSWSARREAFTFWFGGTPWQVGDPPYIECWEESQKTRQSLCKKKQSVTQAVVEGRATRQNDTA